MRITASLISFLYFIASVSALSLRSERNTLEYDGEGYNQQKENTPKIYDETYFDQKENGEDEFASVTKDELYVEGDDVEEEYYDDQLEKYEEELGDDEFNGEEDEWGENEWDETDEWDEGEVLEEDEYESGDYEW